MIPHIHDELLALAELCAVEDLGVRQGWWIDRWEMDDEAVSALVDVYDALLLGGLEDEIAERLEARGVDIEALLVAEDAARDEITRSDLIELAAAAAAIGIDEWPFERMHLPNVPKGSRRASEHGIDIIATTLNLDSNDDDLTANEVLYIASVKHSIDNPSDLRLKLVKSVSEQSLSVPYATQQLRILHGRLAQAGHEVPRIYLFLVNFPDSEHVVIAIAGGVDADLAEDFLAQMDNLPEAAASDHCRHLVVDDIGLLHEKVSNA